MGDKMNRDHDMPEDYATGWNERAEQHRCDEADLRNASTPRMSQADVMAEFVNALLAPPRISQARAIELLRKGPLGSE